MEDTLVELVDGSVNSLFELLNTQQQCRRTGYIWDREAYGMDLEEEPDHHTTKGLSMQPQKFLSHPPDPGLFRLFPLLFGG